MPKEIFDYLMSYWPIVALISFLLSIILLIFIIYYFFKLKEIEKADKEKYGFIETPDLFEDTSVKNERWLRVLEHLETESPTEWRSAILEADIILDEMTKKMGYHGDNLGERLNSVEKSDFLTLNQAWEAHKVRNMIAHEGSGYILNKREAKRVIDLYRQVFEEFEFI
ncbi:hypothetical protein KKG48_02570 [Patescibacteria group bacterium]|nr:hypothetical protein [Patescibacteria group bacterium]